MTKPRKNSKFLYYFKAVLMRMRPPLGSQLQVKHLLKYYAQLSPEEKEQVDCRVDYYNKLSQHITLPPDIPTLKDFSFSTPSTYYFDTYRYARLFHNTYPFLMKSGDVVDLQPVPTIVKSRPIADDSSNCNSILLNLNKVRHFLFIKDPIPYEQKKKMVLFRGFAEPRANRRLFLKLYENNPLCDAKDVKPHNHARHDKNKLTLSQQLQYRYIMALEGKDVASNLKWIMSSNSLAVMPRPTYETWFMEGRLIPDYHYIEVKSDFSDLLERIEFYESHPQKVAQILENAHKYVSQFLDPRKEDLIAFLVLKKYFHLTCQ